MHRPIDGGLYGRNWAQVPEKKKNFCLPSDVKSSGRLWERKSGEMPWVSAALPNWRELQWLFVSHLIGGFNPTPLKNMSSSDWIIIPTIGETTNQVICGMAPTAHGTTTARRIREALTLLSAALKHVWKLTNINDLVVSINGGWPKWPKWMVYNGKSHLL